MRIPVRSRHSRARVPRTGRRARHRDPHGREIGGGQLGAVQQAPEHRGDSGKDRHAPRADGRHDRVGREALDQRDGRAREQRREQRPVQPERMREREGGQHDVRGRQRHHRARPRFVGQRERRVREHRALGAARASRRVEDQRGVAAGTSALRPFRREPFHVFPAYEQRGREVGEDLGLLGRLQERVERSHGGAELPDGEQGHREGPVVADREGDPVARPRARARQGLGERAGLSLELGEGERAALPDEGGLVGKVSRGGVEAAAEALRHRGAQAKKSLRLIRCQTSAGTRWRGV